MRHNCEKLNGLFNFTTTNSTMPEMIISSRRPSKKSMGGVRAWFPEVWLTRKAVTKLKAAIATTTFQSPRRLWDSKWMTGFSVVTFSMLFSAIQHIDTETMGSSMAETHCASMGMKCVIALSVDPPIFASKRQITAWRKSSFA